jgi:alkylhydroperoxidase/carboxymuconolactone decarboxylase family protein YurZ
MTIEMTTEPVKSSCGCGTAATKASEPVAVTTMAPAAPASSASPDPARLIELAPDIDAHFRAYADAVRTSGPLDDQCRATAVLAAALALGNQSTAKRYLAEAKVAGLSNEMIGHTAALVDLARLELRQGATATPQAVSKPKPKSNSCC